MEGLPKNKYFAIIEAVVAIVLALAAGNVRSRVAIAKSNFLLAFPVAEVFPRLEVEAAFTVTLNDSLRIGFGGLVKARVGLGFWQQHRKLRKGERKKDGGRLI